MAKVKSSFFCQSCGYETPKWMGKCPSCSEWNTFVEEVVEKNTSQVVAFSTSGRTAKPQALQSIESQNYARIVLKDNEINLDKYIDDNSISKEIIKDFQESGWRCFKNNVKCLN